VRQSFPICAAIQSGAVHAHARVIVAVALALGVVACGNSAGQPSPPDGGSPDGGGNGDGGSGARVDVQLVDLPALFGHQTVTRVRASDPAGVVKVELYLDDMRVGVAEVAPFDVHWDASGFDGGSHRLRALAYASDGRTGDAEATIEIDHTPPEVELPALTATRDQSFVVSSSDRAGVAQVVIRQGGATIATLTEAPYQFAWPGGLCGTIELRILATDRLGNEGDVRQNVQAVDTHDLDCDDEPAILFGGADCDDSDAAFGPRAPDPGGSLIDFNCDGLPGVDADGDGVPSTATGGTDCDDTASAIHGLWPGWTGVPLDLGPGSSSLESIALDDASSRQVLVFVDGNGDLRFASAPLVPTAPVRLDPEIVAVGVDSAVDRRPVVLGDGTDSLAIAFFAGSALKVATRGATDTAWTFVEVDPGTDSRLRHVDIARSLATLHLVYEAGDAGAPQLRYATDKTGSWSTETVPESSPAHDARIGINQFLNVPVLVYKNATALRHAQKISTTWSMLTLFDRGEQISHHALISDGITGVDVMYVVAGADHDDVKLATSSRLTIPFARETIADRVSQLVVASTNHSILTQLTARSGGAPSVSAPESSGDVAQRLQGGGTILGATHSLRASKRAVLSAPGQPLRLIGVTGRVLPGVGDNDCRAP
jgi:hypothetical protein